MGNFFSSLNDKHHFNRIMEFSNTINDIEKQFIAGMIEEDHINEIIQIIRNIPITSTNCATQRDFICRLELIKQKR